MSGEYVNGCELPSNFYKLDFKTQFNITDYLDQLNPIEVKPAKRNKDSRK